MSFHVHVDATNPGQFFACCGLLELAYRLTGQAAGHFDREGGFHVDAACSLPQLIDRLSGMVLQQVDAEDDASSPIRLPHPFAFLVDWWKDEHAGGKELKVWAGTMQSVRIAQAMIGALRDRRAHDESILNFGCVVYDQAEPTKKVEPFYFDARRAPNAHSRDVGFSPNDLELITTAFPAVEALCLVGLQRCRPAPTERRRVFDYCTWAAPLPPAVLSPLVAGAVHVHGGRRYRFENWYRTGQKKHKAFRPATRVE